MIKDVLKNSFIYTFSNVLTKGISFFLLPVYTAILSPIDYGIIELCSVLTTLGVIFFTLQLNEGTGRFFHEQESTERRALFSSTIIWAVLGSYSCMVVLWFLFTDQLSVFIGVSKEFTYLIALSIALNGIFYIVRSHLRWKLLPYFDAISSLTYSLTTILFMILFLVVLRLGLKGVFYAQICGGAIGVVVALSFQIKDLVLRFSVPIFRKVLGFGLPLMPFALSIFSFHFSDRLVIKEFLGLDDLGVFAVGGKIAMIITAISIGLGSALTPLIYKHHKDSETPKKLGQLLRLYIVLAIGFCFVLVCFDSYLIDVMAGEKYFAVSLLLPFMLLSVFFSNLSQFFPGLVIHKKTSTISWIGLFCGVLNCVLNIYLVPIYGLIAAAISTLISFFLYFVLYSWFANKYYQIQMSWLRLTVGLTIIIFVWYLNSFLQVESNLLNRIAQAIIGLGLIVIAIIPVKEMRYYLNYTRTTILKAGKS